MTDTTAPPRRPLLWPTLAVTGIAVGISIIVLGIYLAFFKPGCCASMKADMTSCCAGMKDDMKNMKMPQPPGSSMTPMPGMPATSIPVPTPGR